MTPILPAGASPALAPTPAPTARGRFAALLEGTLPAVAPRTVQPPGKALLHAVERAQARLDGVLAASRAGRTFTAQELLGLQSEAYRAAQTVDLAARLVEQGAQSVKQALNTQV
ncbi:MAG: hypothetical protein QM767_10290 [Anaeromyxobacter sp.]